MASGKRQRKRERRGQGATAAELAAYIHQRIVCDKCGLEQPFRVAPKGQELAPCEGPLGLTCDSETAVFLDTFVLADPAF